MKLFIIFFLFFSNAALSQTITKEWCSQQNYTSSPCDTLATAYALAKKGEVKFALDLTGQEIKTLQRQFLLSKDLTGEPGDKTMSMIDEYKTFFNLIAKMCDAMISKAAELGDFNSVPKYLDLKQKAEQLNSQL